MQLQKVVSWNTYAQKYDLLLAHNPFYQQLHRKVMEVVGQWDIGPGEQIADIGAGTGNYSLAIARNFPEATVLHVDKHEGMNALAAKKKSQGPVTNLKILSLGVEEITWEPGTLQGLVSVHALYTFPDPTKVLRKMNEWLSPGGKAVLVNAGRIVNVLNWQLAIGWHLWRKHGIKKTLDILKEGKEVSRQNAYIRKMQRQGVFWTHSHEEFYRAVQEAGFEVVSAQKCFRGVSDFVVAKKQE